MNIEPMYWEWELFEISQASFTQNFIWVVDNFNSLEFIVAHIPILYIGRWKILFLILFIQIEFLKYSVCKKIKQNGVTLIRLWYTQSAFFSLFFCFSCFSVAHTFWLKFRPSKKFFFALWLSFRACYCIDVLGRVFCFCVRYSI